MNQIEESNTKENHFHERIHDESLNQLIEVASKSCEENIESYNSPRIEQGKDITKVVKLPDMDDDRSDCAPLGKSHDGIKNCQVNRRKRKRKRPDKSKTADGLPNESFVSDKADKLEKPHNFSSSECFESPEKHLLLDTKSQRINSGQEDVTLSASANSDLVPGPDIWSKVKVFKRTQKHVADEITSTVLSIPPSIGSLIRFRVRIISIISMYNINLPRK